MLLTVQCAVSWYNACTRIGLTMRSNRVEAHGMRGRLGDRGMALIGVLVLSALLMALAVALAVAVRSDTQLRGAFASGVTGFYAAESGLNKGMGEYRNIFLEYNVPNGADFNERTLTVGTRTVNYKMTERAGNPQNITIPSGEVFSGLNAIQYRYIVNSSASNVNTDIEAGVGAEFLVGYVPLFQFVAFYKNDLEIAPGPNMILNGRVHTNGNLYLNTNNGSTLQVADNPAQNVFTIQVSAGKNINRGRKDDGTCAGTVSVDMLKDTVAPPNDLDPKNLDCVGGVRVVPASEIALWKGSMITNLGNIAIPEPDIIKPPVGVSNGGTGDPGVYWEKADLRIMQFPGPPVGPALWLINVVDGGGNVDAVKTAALYAFMQDAAWNNGLVAGRGPSSYRGTLPVFYTDVPFAAGSGCAQGVPNCNNHLVGSYTPPINALRVNTGGNESLAYTSVMGPALGAFDTDFRRGGFYNWREKKWMLLLNINVRDLIWWNDQNGQPFFATNDNTEGGIVIFATVDGPLSNTFNNYGVRIFGTADLPSPPMPGGIGVSADPTGVTIVSDQAMYVLGDFNRGVAGGGVARQPASIIGDSVNLLSQNYWRSAFNCGANCCTNRYCRDGQSVRDIGQAERNAATTWINAALLGGVDTTPDGALGHSTYNGGLENYPRFHENWGGTNLTYQGSFVSLGTPEHVNGAWCDTGGPPCNIYNPPVRLWNFDAGYNNAANLPPLTPRFVYVQQVLFTEDFK